MVYGGRGVTPTKRGRVFNQEPGYERPEWPEPGPWLPEVLAYLSEMMWPLFVLLWPGCTACVLYNLYTRTDWTDNFLLGVAVSAVWGGALELYHRARFSLNAVYMFGHVRPPWR